MSATYHSRQGLIASAWSRSEAGVTLRVSVPVNAVATIQVPTDNPAEVTESDVPAATAPGVTAVRTVSGGIEVDVGSGSYEFVAN